GLSENVIRSLRLRLREVSSTRRMTGGLFDIASQSAPPGSLGRDRLHQPIDLVEVGDGRPEDQLVCPDALETLQGLGGRGRTIDEAVRHPLHVWAHEAVVLPLVLDRTFLDIVADGVVHAGDESRPPGPAGRLPGLLRRLIQRAHLLEIGATAGDEAVAPATDPGHGRRGIAPDQDLRPAGAGRRRADRTYAVTDRLSGPDPAHHIQLFFEAPPAPAERFRGGLEIIFTAADSKTQRETAAADRVVRSGLLGE